MGSCGGVIVLPHTVTPLEDEGTALLATLQAAWYVSVHAASPQHM